MRERRRGDPALRAGQKVRIYRKHWEDEQEPASGSSKPAQGAAEEPPARNEQHADIVEHVVHEEETDAHPDALSGGNEHDHAGHDDKVVTAEEGSHDHVAHEVEPPTVAEITHYDPPSPDR
ncbi:hypothetical protein FA09DRAFT_327694 [Tilletiopsis washingtonensis]|uniref:Uncharacterized protein n=1 Tax=Tilletiopsis washingtonensis TaxID=58919 RepID=A0A316ZKS1_9BASI|nr:hypothetical protein FA09DRAFT_327694 [Tilletiopsis washingtonensis]PWO00986.1 hypothetical protein FA09DRAFT_327694 [Tilletiopsis washingtonensis]